MDTIEREFDSEVVRSVSACGGSTYSPERLKRAFDDAAIDSLCKCFRVRNSGSGGGSSEENGVPETDAER